MRLIDCCTYTEKASGDCSGVNPPGDPCWDLWGWEVIFQKGWDQLASPRPWNREELGKISHLIPWAATRGQDGPEIQMVGERVRMAGSQTLHFLCLASADWTQLPSTNQIMTPGCSDGSLSLPLPGPSLLPGLAC